MRFLLFFPMIAFSKIEVIMKIRPVYLAVKAQRALLSVSLTAFVPHIYAQSEVEAGLGKKVADQTSFFKKVPIDLNGTETLATLIDGVDRTVDASDLPDNYLVINGGQLNVVGGGAVGTVLVEQSTLKVVDGSVLNGIINSDGQVILDQAQVSSSVGIGLRLSSNTSGVNVHPTARVQNSSVTGVGIGLATGVRGELWVHQSSINVTSLPGDPGVALRMDGGVAHLGGKSRILGDLHGIAVVDGSRGPDGSVFNSINRFEIDNSLVSSSLGAAIKVHGSGYRDGVTKADIVISNGAEIYAGNGNLLEVERNSDVKLQVLNSRLFGNIIAEEGADLAVELADGASLTGNLINIDYLRLGTSAQWNLTEHNVLNSLSFENGRLSFTTPDFHTLTVGTLSGNGTFDMRINLDTAQGDLLNVTGQATGHHQLNVQNTGVEAVKPEFEPLRIVHTEGGDAQFGLIGGRVDLGAYSYLLEKQDNDWFIVGEGKVISPSTQSALALFNAAPAIWNSELTTLRSRMGEVRGQEEGGGWIRSYGNRFNAGTGAGIHYQQKQQGLSFGADAPIPVSNGSLVIGVMGGYSKSDLDLSRGTSGEVNSYYAGAYGTWLLDDGYYLDGVLKLNKFRNESEVAMSDGTKAKGRYNNTALGGSVEFGRHIKLSDNYFVEPYTQLSSVFIGGDSYTLSNGLKAKDDRTQSLLGKVGTTAGRDFTLKDGSVLQPYVRVALAHEFAHDNEVKVNETRFDNSLSGSRLELGAGVAVSLSKRVQLHADFDYMKGEHVEQPWGANVGLKLAF
jgi:outer membrane autotransporter protein